MNRRDLVLRRLVFVAFVVRLALLLISTGTDDAHIWQFHGANVWLHGFAGAYAKYELLNHPPLVVLWSAALRWIGTNGHIHFPWLFKIPVFACDVLTTVVLYKAWQRRAGLGWAAAAAWAWSPASILIGEYHCNTDNIIAGLALTAGHLVFLRRPALAGLVLAAAVNVKIIPILLLPALAVACRDRRAALRFCGMFAVGMLPFAVGYAVAGKPFISNIFGYKGYSGWWGIPLILGNAATFQGYPPQIASLHLWYLEHGRYAVFGAMGLLAGAAWIWRQRWDAYQITAMGMSLFLIFSPAFAVQYAVLPLAAMIGANIRRGAMYGLAAGLMLTIVYVGRLVHEFPLRSDLSAGPQPPSQLLAVILWGSLVGFVVHTVLWPGSTNDSDARTADA